MYNTIIADDVGLFDRHAFNGIVSQCAKMHFFLVQQKYGMLIVVQ